MCLISHFLLQLTAEQNLTFIEPFCKAMAKTKEYDLQSLISWSIHRCDMMLDDHLSFSCLLFSRVLLKAIGGSVFNTIVDQVPFAIEDLLREIRQGDGEEPDASDGSEDQQDNEELKTESSSKKKTEGAQDHGG